MEIYSSFFQSSMLGKFQESLPYRGKSWTLLTQQVSCLVIKIKLPLNFCWLWVPYGPLAESGISNARSEADFTSAMHQVSSVFGDLEKIAQEEKAVFARIEPPPGLLHSIPTLRSGHSKTAPAPNRYTPQHTLVLDLNKTEGEILAQMKPKGRYNIRVAKKHNIKIERIAGADVDENILNNFYEILEKTGTRDEFGIHPKYFYKNLLEIFGKERAADLFLAKTPDGKIIAGIIVIYYKDTATYYYGASDYEHRNLMAPYLLQWEAILEAQRRGMKYYDFLGISSGEETGREKTHPWAGVTEFKKKFGGREVNYPPAFDIIYKPALYRFMKIAKRFL